MSDYGSAIKLRKKDKLPVTNTDIQWVKQEVDKIKNHTYTNALGEPLLYKFVTTENDRSQMLIYLSEYWDGDGDDEALFEFAKDNDLVQCEDISKGLSKSIGGVFAMEPVFESW